MNRTTAQRLAPAIAFLLFGALSAAPLLAHNIGAQAAEGPHNWHELWTTWGWEPGSLIGLALWAVFYCVGLARQWRAAGVGHGIRRWEAGCFAAGWLTLFIALISPLHPWGEVLFSAHMTQHELLMLVAAPLLVLSCPLVAFLRALPPGWAGALARRSNTRTWRAIWGAITYPLIAWFIHGAILWGWHDPYLFQATLHHEWVHAFQHLSFLLSAMLFWWALIHGRRGALGYGLATLYMFTTALHSGLLGALLTLAGTVWYPDYAHSTGAWGLSPLQDQQLGGLIMWVPACAVYIVAGLALFAGWLRESEQRVRAHERTAWGAGVGAGANVGAGVGAGASLGTSPLDG